MGKSLREIVYEKLRESITSGRVAPGERLLEVKLVEEFKASRSPVREALRLLEAEGLITFERNKGITVAKLSIKEVNEIYDVRYLLESHAARVAAQNATKEDVAYLEDLQSKLRAAAKNMDSLEWLHNNALFHNFFSEKCGNSHLIRIVDNLKRRVFRYHYITVSIPWQFETYLEHHEVMLLGCRKNDGEMAEKYMKLHLESIRDVLVSHLNMTKAVYA